MLPASGGCRRGARHVQAGSVAMVAYPMQQMAAFARAARTADIWPPPQGAP